MTKLSTQNQFYLRYSQLVGSGLYVDVVHLNTNILLLDLSKIFLASELEQCSQFYNAKYSNSTIMNYQLTSVTKGALHLEKLRNLMDLSIKGGGVFVESINLWRSISGLHKSPLSNIGGGMSKYKNPLTYGGGNHGLNQSM